MVLRLKAWESRSLPDLQKRACLAVSWENKTYYSGNFGSATKNDAGWSSPVARQAHNLKVVGSNPTPATNKIATKSIRVARAILSRIALFCVCSQNIRSFF